MQNTEPQHNNLSHHSIRSNVIDMNYLNEMMNGNKQLVKEIIDLFLQQVPAELSTINIAVAELNYLQIKTIAHTMRSSLAVLGISVLTPALQEMERLSGEQTGATRIKELNTTLQLIGAQALEDVQTERLQYD